MKPKPASPAPWDRGRRFLLLAGSIGVVLAGIALALASHHFASGQILQVALLKSWGTSASRVRSLYLQQIILLGTIGSLIGLFVGWSFHQLLISVVREWLPIALPTAGPRPWITGMATGMLCLGRFYPAGTLASAGAIAPCGAASRYAHQSLQCHFARFPRRCWLWRCCWSGIAIM